MILEIQIQAARNVLKKYIPEEYMKDRDGKTVSRREVCIQMLCAAEFAIQAEIGKAHDRLLEEMARGAGEEDEQGNTRLA